MDDGGQTALALGYFDGVHVGHAEVVEAMVQCALAKGLTPAVFTFTRDNGASSKGMSILSQRQKEEVLSSLGVEICFEPPFSSFHDLPPQAFFEQKILGEYRAKALFCGENFRFGAGRAGDVILLKTLCDEHGLKLTTLPLAVWKGAPVSSSRIRGTLSMGEVEDVNAMLGRPYEVELPVRHGKGLGRQFGFPTLNQLYPEDMQPPAHGVYITSTLVDGTWHPSATGYGTRPTVDGDATPSCETFIPGFVGDLYGKDVRVRFYKKIAETQKFDSPEALAVAVQGWARQAEEYFKTGHRA